ncbi:hypothetical protein K438DRAFT_1993185 [Mycena galopus ATCC 62051]|nr:hypothetical protein K438DRAFT_1993185 [Mycena galopus ATCC 62051]
MISLGNRTERPRLFDAENACADPSLLEPVLASLADKEDQSSPRSSFLALVFQRSRHACPTRPPRPICRDRRRSSSNLRLRLASPVASTALRPVAPFPTPHAAAGSGLPSPRSTSRLFLNPHRPRCVSLTRSRYPLHRRELNCQVSLPLLPPKPDLARAIAHNRCLACPPSTVDARVGSCESTRLDINALDARGVPRVCFRPLRVEEQGLVTPFYCTYVARAAQAPASKPHDQLLPTLHRLSTTAALELEEDHGSLPDPAVIPIRSPPCACGVVSARGVHLDLDLDAVHLPPPRQPPYRETAQRTSLAKLRSAPHSL